jgi:hypothetical protein
MIAMKTVCDLMAEVAIHLSGKADRVRVTKPEAFDGLCWRDEAERLTIDVSPDLSDKDMMYVFLHDLSHAKHHSYKPVTEAVMDSLPGAPSYQSRESQADKQAYTWL